MSNTEKFDQFKRFAKKAAIPAALNSKKAVIFTRVSSKRQVEGASLETQNQACIDVAKSKGLSIVKHFGGSHESAKSGDGKEFMNCISFVKKRSDIGYIIVYALDRISRSIQAMAEIEKLQKKGVAVISATQDFDTSTPMGSLLQELVMMVGKAENVNKTKRSVDGMRNKLLRGEWMGTTPLGYTNHNPGKRKKQDFRINQEGKLLAKAFKLKAEQNLSYEEIARKLKPQGWTKPAKKFYELFRNPFYCGLIVSKRIDGQVVKGIHPPLISEEVFLKVNGLLASNAQGWSHNPDDENLPLKGMIISAKSGTPYTGYCVRKKGLYYYKNNVKGAKENISAKKMHALFQELLANFTVADVNTIPVLKEMMMELYLEVQQQHIDSALALHDKLDAVNKDIEMMEERYALGKISDEVYERVFGKYDQQRFEIQQELEKTDFDLSNLESALDKALQFALNLPKRWASGDLEERRTLQNIVFPEGILYDKENHEYRTPRVNSLFAPIPLLAESLGQNKNGTTSNVKKLSHPVPRVGIEPTLS